MDDQGVSQDTGCDEPSSPTCSQASSNTEPQTAIHDPFAKLDPSEQTKVMAAHLQRYIERATDSHKRTLHRVLDTISVTEGSDAMHLDILATHMGKESRKYCDQMTWPGDLQFEQEIARPSDLKVSDEWTASGVFLPHNEENIAQFLRELDTAARKNADRELLGAAAETLSLPAEFCEFVKQCGGIYDENFDRHKFMCSFGSQFYVSEELALPLEKMRRTSFGDSSWFELAAGWRMGYVYSTTSLYHLLCTVTDDMDEPWQLRIGYFEYDAPEDDLWDSLPEFLEWYCKGYDHVRWENVEGNIKSIHEECLEDLEKRLRTEAWEGERLLKGREQAQR
ncbi:hypothetical protein KCU81_g4758, partial [Aureobasidium melanogenum]|uniref:Uncharacterized protein n=1 Tax=Aureobasidium melanogenum (strain CBS 110374) TaxID=1043003 RepID=A0A074VGA0_AURM1